MKPKSKTVLSLVANARPSTASNAMKANRLFPLLAGLCSFQMQLTAAPSIGVNFVNGGDGVNNGAVDSLGPAESAGAPTFAQINWNNLGRWGQDVVLNPTAGTSGVKVHWDSIGTWQNGASNATGDGKLMSGYLDASWGTGTNSPIAPNTSVYGVGNNNKPMIFVGNVGSWLASPGVNATTYSVVIYFDGDSSDGGRTAEFWLQNATGTSSSMTTTDVIDDLTPHIFATDSANFSGTYTQATSTAEAGATGGNYIVFTGLSADQFLIRGEEHGWASDAITGFQIIADAGEVIPEGSYWKGGAVGDPNSWMGANWTSDPAGNNPAALDTIVTFAATGATNLATVLGADQSISKLDLNNGVGAVQIGSAVGFNHNLTLGSGGISIESGSGPLTINTTGQVILEGDQTWINNAAGALTVDSVIAGDYRLTTAGGGTTLLTAANVHTGGTTVQSGTLKIATDAAIGSGSLVVNGTLDIGGLNPTFGSLSGSGIVQNTTASACSLTLNTSANITYGCQIKDGPGGGPVSLVKTGSATATSTGASNFTGSVTIENGQFIANYPNYGGAPTTSSLGNLQIPGRTITVTYPGELRLTNNNIFGNQNANSSLLPEVIVNATTMSATSFNLIGNVTLNAATLSQSTGNGWADYQGYQFRGLVKVVKDLVTPGASFISGTNNGGNHLSANTIFEVEDVDAGAGVDLTVSAPLINPSGDFGYPAARGGFTKSGAGTMSLSVAATYTGNTVVSEGTLALSTPSLSDTRTISVASGATLQLDFPVENNTDIVGSLVLDGVTKPNGTYGAIGSGAGVGFETALITGTGFIQVIGLPDPFGDWIATFTSLSGLDSTRGADPDGDGLTNIQEFAFNSIPESGEASGKIRTSVETITGQQALVLTLPVRNGAAFTGNTPAAIATVSDDYDDHLGYRIEGTNDLSAFDQQVSVVNPAVSAGLPALDTGWTYRSFRLDGNVGGATPRGPEGFLRAVVIDTP